MCYICDEEKGVENTNLEGPNGQIFLCPVCRKVVIGLIRNMANMHLTGKKAGQSICNEKKAKAESTKACKYPECTYYDPKAKSYCCNACAGDHYDYDRLQREKDLIEIRRHKMGMP